MEVVFVLEDELTKYYVLLGSEEDITDFINTPDTKKYIYKNIYVTMHDEFDYYLTKIYIERYSEFIKSNLI